MLAVSNYHYIRNDFETPYPSIFGVTPIQFKKQLEEFSKHGAFISLQDLVQFIDKPFDKNYILITFDDGLKEQFELAKPILNAMGIPYVCFINTMNYTEQRVSLVHKVHLIRSQLSSKYILEVIQTKFPISLSQEEKIKAIKNYSYDTESVAYLKYLLNFKLSFEQQETVISTLFDDFFDEKKIANELYLSSSMLQTMYHEGVLGSHSHTHIPLGIYDESIIHQELNQSQDFFQQTFGKPAFAVSYPYGSLEACKNVDQIAKEKGFQLGFSMERAMVKNLKDNPLMISRYDCNDMPLGKSDLFKTQSNLFNQVNVAQWYRK